MENIDYKLDLLNALKKYRKESDKDNDSLFLLSNNTKNNIITIITQGNLNDLIPLITSRAYVSIPVEKRDPKSFVDLQNFILNMALSILKEEKYLIKSFIDSLQNN